MPSIRIPARYRRLALLALGAGGALTLAFVSAGRAQEPPPARLWLPALLSRAPIPSPAPGSPVPTAATVRPPATTPPSATPGAAPSSSPVPTASPPPQPSAQPTSGAEACDAIASFEDGLAPRRELHVSPRGDDASGDGSPARPFRSLGPAARAAEPGTAIRLHSGSYAGGSYLEGLRGTAAAPIWLGGMPGEARPRVQGGGTALHLSRAAWLVVHDLELSGQSDNGINADDGGAVADPLAAGPLIFRGLAIEQVGGGGNQDCLKLSGIRGVLVIDSAFARCGGGGSGSGIDMVGVHEGLVARSRFQDLSANAVQVKGGSTDIEIRWNHMLRAGERAVNMGGSTGLEYFRPPLDNTAENAEARRVKVLANHIEGGVTPWAFVGCVDCLAAQNTVVEPTRWLMRILQETSSQGEFRFAPAGSGRVINNLFVFRRGQIRADVNVGAGTAPETFRFQNNLWFAVDDPGRSAPGLPVAETGGIVGRDPLLRADGAIPPGSPAVGAGWPGPWAPGDLAGVCWADPPAIGAREGR